MHRVLIVAAAAAALLAASPAGADDYVSGYTRSNGTVVAPYMRSSPDSSVGNNFSTYGNTNPYTGATGTHHPSPTVPTGFGPTLYR